MLTAAIHVSSNISLGELVVGGATVTQPEQASRRFGSVAAIENDAPGKIRTCDLSLRRPNGQRV